MKNYLIKTKLACEFARVDRQQFSDAVSSGLYGCAPETKRGSTRLFTVDHVVALMIFGRLTRIGVTLREAAHIACSMYSRFAYQMPMYDETLPLVAYVELIDGTRTAIMSPRQLPSNLGGGAVVGSIAFDIPALRALVERLAEEHARIIGDDDET